MSPAKGSSSEASDSRHARSERTRAALVDALLALLAEGDVQPSAERIADRAGVSRRAIFNHFRDVEDLFATASDRQLERVLPTLRPPLLGGPTRERAATAAAEASRLHAAVAPVRRAALLVEHSSKAVAGRLGTMRRLHRARVEAVFAPELDACPGTERVALAAALTTLLSFSTWEELITHQGLEPTDATLAIRRLLEAALSPFEQE